MIFSIKPQIFELKCVFSYFRLKTHITLLLPVYVHSWEQRKLGEIGSVSMCRRIFKEQTSENGEIPFYKIGTFGGEADAFISRELFEEYKAKYQYPKKGDILISASGSIGRTVVFTGKNEYFQDSNIVWLNHDKHLDNSFLKCFYSIVKWAGIEGSTIKRLYNDNILNTAITLPSVEEQQKIGAYFENLDNLITLHQRKCQIDGCRFQSPLAITWEQRKVTEIGKIYIGLVTTMTKHYTDEGTLLIRNSDIKDGKFEFGDNPIYLEKTFAEKNETRMHQIGDVITVHTGDVGTSAVITENEAKSIGFATIVTRPNPKIIDSNYLCSFLNTDKHKKWAVSISTGDGRTNYNLGDYFELVVPVPSIAEQKRIASYIQKLNRLITLHQRKYDKLTNVKKSMLGKMFPQNGSNVPEIRFKGFTEAWEQRKLSEIATMHARIGWQNLRTSEFLDNGDYMLITGTDFMDGAVNFDTCHYVERERYEQDKHIQIRNGSILITKDGTLGKVAYIQGLTMPATLNAGVFNVEIRDEKEVDNRYLFQYLKAPFLMDYVDKKATGGTIKHLNQNILVDFPVVLPQKDEQAKIGEYFLGIDNLITLHQRELEKLKNLKKACLEKMFV